MCVRLLQFVCSQSKYCAHRNKDYVAGPLVLGPKGSVMLDNLVYEVDWQWKVNISINLTCSWNSFTCVNHECAKKLKNSYLIVKYLHDNFLARPISILHSENQTIIFYLYRYQSSPSYITFKFLHIIMVYHQITVQSFS